jgi:hypothetical protein
MQKKGKRMREKRCNNCLGFDPDRSECRMNPPVPVDDGTRIYVKRVGVWPKVKPEDWCGSWEEGKPNTGSY